MKKRFGGQVHPHMAAGAENYALGPHEIHAPCNDALIQLHVGNAVGEQTAYAVAALQDGDAVAVVVEAIGACQPGGTAAHHRDALSRARGRGMGLHMAACEGIFNDAELILANGDLRLMDAAGAGAFTGRGTYPAGEFREAVGHQQTLRRRFPLAAVEQVVPFGNQVVKRTAGWQASDHQAAVAEGHGTAHAPRRLLPLLLLGKQAVDLVPVVQPLQRVAVRRQLAVIFQKTKQLAHAQPSSLSCRAVRRLY